MSKLKVTTLFSGIGAQEAGLKRLGVDFEMVGMCEIDKYAIKSYEGINGPTHNYGDISKIDRLDYADLLVYSSPCVDFSLAGKQAGLIDTDGKQTRSGLLLEVGRLLMKMSDEKILPKYLLMENVKNLVGKKFKPAFDIWLKALEAIGYNNYWKVLNAKDYGVPQNRERVFVVSIRKDVDTHGYTFPEPFKLNRRLKDVLEKEVDEKFYLKQDLAKSFIERLSKREVSNTIRCGGAGSIDQKHTWDLVVGSTQKNAYKGQTSGISPCLTGAMGMGGGQIPMIVNGEVEGINQKHTWDSVAEPFVLEKGIGHNPVSKKFEFDGFHENKPCPTLLATDYKCPKCYSDGVRIRKLTPKECWRLMDFTDEEYEAAEKAGVSKTQLYKQAGNSIVVSCLAHIFRELLKGTEYEPEEGFKTDWLERLKGTNNA